MPKVSVIITCYNLGQYLDEAVNSVLSQTYQDFEILIVNDGSTDDFTNGLLAAYQRAKTTVYHTENQGLPSARNYGIERATGEYVCCLDADDKYHTEFLEKTVVVFEKDLEEKFGIVTTNYQLFENSTNKIDVIDFDPYILAVENCLHVASLFRRKCWRLVGGFAVNLSGYQDWSLWLAIIARGYKWFTIKEYLFFYRDRAGSMLKRSDKNRNEIFQLIISNNREFYKNNFEAILKEFIVSSTKNLAYIKDLLSAVDYFKSQLENTQSKLENTQSQLDRLHLNINKILPQGSFRRRVLNYFVKQLGLLNGTIDERET